MKILSWVIAISLFLFLWVKCSLKGPDPADRFANQLIKKIGKKYNLEGGVIGGSASGAGTMKITMKLCAEGQSLTPDEGRRFIVALTEEFLEEFNKNEKIRPYLAVWPFTVRNISLSVYFYAEDGISSTFYPYLDIIASRYDEIAFFTLAEENPKYWNTKRYEPYAEALAIVRKEKELEKINEQSNLEVK